MKGVDFKKPLPEITGFGKKPTTPNKNKIPAGIKIDLFFIITELLSK